MIVLTNRFELFLHNGLEIRAISGRATIIEAAIILVGQKQSCLKAFGSLQQSYALLKIFCLSSIFIF